MKKVELLAPAGTPVVLRRVIEAGADAVYLGGKNFNMRQHRSDYNFDEHQMKKAVASAHDEGIKLYVTVNSLFRDEEIPALIEYLGYLDEIMVDAIIIQDMGLLHHLSGHKYNFAVHASTMMNVHNAATAKILRMKGVSRIVTSRDISVDQVVEIARGGNVECEYFIHGDMCASQSGQCYHSGILFGQSANKGRCLKSCRWPYQFYDITRQKPVSKKQYYLARKDMCMIRHVDLLIEKGIASLKIEGRMKDGDHLYHVVNSYRKVIDGYYANPYTFNVHASVLRDMQKNGIRDFSSCFAIKKARLETVGLSGAKEPRFFSRAVVESRARSGHHVANDTGAFPDRLQFLPRDLSLTVHVSTLEALEAALAARPSWVYLDTRMPVSYWNDARVSEALGMAEKAGVPAALSIPSVMSDGEVNSLDHYLKSASHAKPDAFLAGNLGVIGTLVNKGVENVFADYSLNVINGLSAAFLKGLGVKRYCASPEFPFCPDTGGMENEILVHGPLPYMQFESCYIFNIKGKNADYCQGYCSGRRYGFMDEAGELHEIVPDTRCRNYFMSASHLCLLDNLHHVLTPHVRYLRIDARLYQPDVVGLLLRLYGEALKAVSEKGYHHSDREDTDRLDRISPFPLGSGAYCRTLNLKKAI